MVHGGFGPCKPPPPWIAALPAAQRAAVLALVEELAALREITQCQEHLIAELNHALHGKRSEKLPEDERQLAFEDLSIALAQVEAERDGLDIVPAQLRVIVTIRPRYACRGCTDGVIPAPAPAHLIPGSQPTEATLAQVLVSKYADHLPLYRQSQILARAGLDLHRAVLADWSGQGSLPPQAHCRSAGRASAAVRQAVHG